jgi:hypothetical protein
VGRVRTISSVKEFIINCRFYFKILLCISPFFFIPLIPCASEAVEDNLEKEIQETFVESKTLAESIKSKLSQGGSVSGDVAQLKAAAEKIRVNDLLVKERFSLREEKAKSLGSTVSSRHAAMTEGYRKALSEYLSLVDKLPSDSQTRNSQLATTVQQLIDLLDKLLPKKKKRLIGSLPYKHLNYPSQTPSSSAAITPAYLGGNKTVSSDDTKSTEEAPVSKTVADLAQSLKWQPVLIYEHIKNSIETDWGYWGCMKGAEETLRQKSGSSCDQSLLIASLLKASGYPTRIVRATIQFFGGGKTKPMDRAKHLTGLDDPWKIAELFQKAGIPFTPVITGGAVSNIQFDHIFVETQIPWANYRGWVFDTNGKAWLGLDTSIKVKGFTYNNPKDIFEQTEISSQLSSLRDQYLSAVQTLTPVEYVEQLIDNSALGIPHSEFQTTRTLIPEVMNILPGSMQFTLVKATNEYTEIPDELKHKVKFTATNAQSGTTLFETTLPLYKLSNQQIAVTYEPETVEDQQTIDSYGGLDNTPAYLVRLRPVLTINKERIIVAADGLPMGEEFNLTIELISPNSTESVTNTHTVGNLSVIGITAQKTVAGYGFQVTGEKDAERLLYEEAMNYIDRWNQAEDELASLLHLAIARPMPTVVTVGGVIDVTYLLDMPHEFNWKGVYVDADLRRIETVTGYGVTGSGVTSEEREKLFMQLSSLQGSVLENRIFEDDFEVESISTAKLFQVVNAQSQTVTTIDKSNIDSILPTLTLDDSIKEDITNSVNQNYTIRIPQSGTDISYQDWSGIGYLKENAETGESGWMLTGMIAGGMTALTLDKWPSYYASRLSNPYSEPANEDPASAQSIQKITTGDLQTGIAGSKLSKPLQVKVYDQNKKPVEGAEVTFTVKAGGGKLGENLDSSVTVTTDSTGVASVNLTLGKDTSVNSTFWWYDDKSRPLPDQAGENIVDAALSSGTAITTPFTEYGLPGTPTKVNKVYGDKTEGYALSFAGFVSVSITDNNSNPVSNIPVTFTTDFPVQNTATEPDCNWTGDESRKTYLLETSESCLKNAPTWGTCGDNLKSSLTVTSDYTGAAAEVILGGREDAVYSILASAPTISAPKAEKEKTFEIYTYDLYALYGRSCDNTKDPIRQLKVAYTYATDQYGNNIVSGKTGSTIPVQAKMYSLVEGEALKDKSFACSTGTITCSAITGNRQYDTTTEYTSASVLFSGITGTAEGDGIYTADYTLKSGVNTITIEGTGTLDVQSTTACPECSTVTTPLTQTDTTTMTVYGVDIQFSTIPVILVDQDGYAEQDYSITYTITPSEYTAGNVYTVIYKNNEPVAYLYTEKQGTGKATISRGFQFDLSSSYKVEVVLNSGTGMEIKSGKVDLPVARIEVLTDESTPQEADEIKFGNGANAEKRYLIQLTTKDPQTNCSTFAGRVSVVDKAGAKITAPQDDTTSNISYGKTEYSLTFESSNNACKGILKNAATGETSCSLPD